MDKMGNKAVLVYPKFTGETFWSNRTGLERYFRLNEFGFPIVQSPPLGLLYIADYFKDYYDVTVLDRNVDPRESTLRDLIEDTGVYWVGISGMIGQEENAVCVSKIVGDAGKVLVSGGPFTSRDFVKRLHVSDGRFIAVEGEAESVIDQVRDDLANGRFGTYYKGKWCDPSEFFEPYFPVINLKHYASMNLWWSRGCPNNCDFCDIIIKYGHGPRYTPIEHIERALTQLYGMGYRGPIFVSDDNFTGYPKKAIATLEAVKRIEAGLGYKFPKIAQVDIGLARDTPDNIKLRQLLRETNFGSLFIGIETNNLESLIETGKHPNLSGSLRERVIKIMKETGAGVKVGLILGFDHDTPKSAKSLIEFGNSLPCPDIMLGALKVGPGTALEKRLIEEGRFIERDTGNNSDCTLNFPPTNFSVQEGEELLVEMQKELYGWKAYRRRLMGQLEIIGPPVSIPEMPIGDVLYAFFSVLTKSQRGLFWSGLPGAVFAAIKRFGLSKDAAFIFASYIGGCVRYPHSDFMDRHTEEEQRKRVYGEGQKHSWKEMQEAKSTQ